MEELESREMLSGTGGPLPVLLVIANRDFSYQEYGDTRLALEEAGLRVVVAATTTNPATPHWNSGQGADGGTVVPDVALADGNAADDSAIVLIGGWGASSSQYGFGGSYHQGPYNGDAATRAGVNQLVNDFADQDKYQAAICHGVTVLAWARVDGVSPLAGKSVSAYGGSAPVSTVPGADTTRWHVEANGAFMFASRSIGDPATAADDV